MKGMEKDVILSGETKALLQGISNDSSKQVSNSEALRLVRSVWPKAFSLSSPMPLKIGIHKDMNELNIVPIEVVSIALRFYTSLDRYLQQIKPGVARVDLSGMVAGKVRLKEAVDAEVRLYISSSDHKKISEEKELEDAQKRERYIIRKIRLLSVH